MQKTDPFLYEITSKLSLMLNQSPDERLAYLAGCVGDLTKDQLNKLLFKVMRPYYLDLRVIKLIIEAGADPRYNDDTPFIESCGSSDDIAIPQFFLEECGANLNAQNGQALKNAFDYNNDIMVKFLLDLGMEITEEIIEIAINDQRDENINLFLEAGVNPDLILQVIMRRIFKKGTSNHLNNMLKEINSMNLNYQIVIGKICEEAPCKKNIDEDDEDDEDDKEFLFSREH